MGSANDDANKDQNASGSGEEDKKTLGDEGSDEGSGKKTTEGGDSKDKGLTKEDIQKIVKDTIEAVMKDTVTPEIDRRISGATKTIYKKVGVKEEDDPNKIEEEKKSDKKQRTEMINVYAKSRIKDELGKVDHEISDIVDNLVSIEIKALNLEEKFSNEEFGNQAGDKTVKAIKGIIEKIEKNKVDALKKAGQLIEIGTGENKKTPKDDFDAGKKLAEQRHPKKKKE